MTTLTFLLDDSFIWTSEKGGYNHLYLHDKNGKEKRQLTSGDWEVTAYYGYDQNAKKYFFSLPQWVLSIEMSIRWELTVKMSAFDGARWCK